MLAIWRLRSAGEFVSSPGYLGRLCPKIISTYTYINVKRGVSLRPERTFGPLEELKPPPPTRQAQLLRLAEN